MRILINNTKNLKAIGIISSIFITLYLFLGLITENLQNNSLYVYFSILITLSFPSLFSKVVLKKNFFGIYTVISFLVFPIFWILSLVIGSSFFPTLALLIGWVSMITYFIKNSTRSELQKFTGSYLYLFLVSLFLITIYTIIGRTANSVVANDYLVHQSVVNQMTSTFCLIPSECSNLFLIDTYTSLYHSLIFPITQGFNTNFLVYGYLLDVFFGSLIGFVILQIFKKFNLNYFYSVFGSIITILTFEQGAFTYHLFIPQVFAFYLALQFILEKKFSRAVVPAIFVVIATHFIMGTYILGLMALYYLYKRNLFIKQIKLIKTSEFTAYLGIITLLVLLLSITGFSVEKSFQADEILNLGGATNYYFPDNLKFIFEIIGLNLLFLVIGIVYIIKNKMSSKWTYFAIAYIFAVISVYLLAPIYANKFLIGIGIFSSFMICTFLYELILDNRKKLALLVLFALVTLASFTTNYRFFILFYTQNDGNTSAINNKDLPLIEFINSNDLECVYISDPQTQLTISSLTNEITNSGSYSSLQSRRFLDNFVRVPTVQNLSRVFEIEVTENQNVCFVYTKRLVELSNDETNLWENKIYYYTVDFQGELQDDRVFEFFRSLDIAPQYSDRYSAIFKFKEPL